MTNRVAKFVDCRSKDVGQRELFIVEAIRRSAPVSRRAIRIFRQSFPLRGKILN